MPSAFVRVLFCALPVLLLGGCSGNSGPKTYPVTGVVNFKGQPLPNAVVTFFPSPGRPTAGITNAQGEFTLMPGGLAGVNKVTVAEPAVEMKEGDYSLPPEVPPRFPAKYTDPNQSGLQFEVKPGEENKFTIDLKE